MAKGTTLEFEKTETPAKELEVSENNKRKDINLVDPAPEQEEEEEEEEEQEEQEKPEGKGKEVEEQESEEEEQEEEESEEEESEEEESEEEDLFEDFDLEDEEDEEDAEGVQELASELGIKGVKTKEDLKNHIEELKGRVPEFPDEKTESLVKDIIETGRAGGNVDKVTKFTNKIQDTSDHIERRERLRENLESLKNSADLETKKKWLLNEYYPKFKQIPEGDMSVVKEDYEEISTGELVREFHSAMREVQSEVNSEIERGKSTIDQTKSDLENYKKEVKETKKKAQARIKSAIEEYKDPDGIKSVTKGARKLASKALNSQPTNITLPKGLADLFYKDGQFDPKKAIDVLSAAKFGSKKTEYLKKLAKKETFREEQEYGKKKNLNKDGRAGQETNDEWAGPYRG